ncbi:STAS domain-containing protein [Abyssisolibacter fermentans]|uniref:STAS domain-containing protein n=1 Tax=Abyssisolibacter fermentans TaxID=1766203 RepID=UPI0008363631|nr:STAS domain-containing protein [Abyssisolibacter fermentans]
MSLNINKYKSDNSYILEPIGEIDIYTSIEFKKVLLETIKAEKTDIIIECKNLEYIDSTGLGVLISGLKKNKEYDKDIIIKNIKNSIKKLFEITGLNKVFIIEEEC